MKLTARGKLSIGVLIGLVFSALLFNDLVISLILIAVLLLMLSELVWMIIVVSRPSRFFVLTRVGKGESSQGNTKLVPLGQASTQDFLFKTRARSHVSLASDVSYLRITPNEFEGSRESNVRLEFRSPYSGVYPVENLTVTLRGPLNLFETSLKLNVSVRYSVYPKVYDVALTTSKLLGKSGIGEIPTGFPGIGTEFYDTREYQSGDDIRHVNWKASARLGELIVNDRAKEIGVLYYLVLDSNVTSYFDRDRLASTFLQIVNTLSVLEANFGFLVHEDNKVISFRKADRPQNSLPFALNAALDFVEIQEDFLPEESAPIPSHMIKSTRDLLSKQGLTLLSKIEDLAQSQINASLNQDDAFRAILDIMKENPSEPPAIIYITAMNSSISPLIELSDQVKRVRNGEFMVVNPSKPWVMAIDENEAVKLYETQLKNLSILGNSDVEYHVGDPLQVLEELFD